MKKIRLSLLSRAAVVGSVVTFPGVSPGALITNGLLVNVDATAWSGTGPMANTGSLGGAFATDGTPTKATAAGVSGAFLDGTDSFVGPASPAGITGTGDRTVEAWVYQGAVNGEETLVAWGKRGGGDGTNNSVNWGSNGAFGAFGGWGGGPDQGFGAGQPTKGAWHHIVFTADGTNKNVYVDGNLASSELNNSPALNTHAGLAILLGAQQNGAATPGASVIDGANKLSGVLGKVRVHDGVLSASDVLNNFNEEKALFQNVVQASGALSSGPKHRWSFNEGSGTSFADTGTAATVATAANLLGAGAVVTPTGVDLPGGTSATQAYIDLPNFVASGKDVGPGYTAVTYETWVTTNQNLNWSRIIDFGSSSAGEVTGPGGSFSGSNVLLLSNNIGNGTDMQMERNSGGVTGARAAPGATLLNGEQHIVISYDPADGMWKWYQNGLLMEGFSSDGPASLNDVNNFLGRSNWNGDANTDGTYNEFRIYDYALSPAQIHQNALDGPNVLTIVPEPSTVLLGVAGAAVFIRRRRR